jgi:hypothetical protein
MKSKRLAGHDDVMARFGYRHWDRSMRHLRIGNNIAT